MIQKNSKRIYSYYAMRLLMVIFLSVMMGFLLDAIKNIVYIPVNEYFLISVILFTQILSIVSSILGLSNDIYHSKDNQILLTLPAKNDEIFMSKLIVYYLSEFTKNFYFLLPFLIAYGAMSKLGFFYFLNIIPVMILLPFIAVFLASLLSILVTIIDTFLSKHPWLSFVVTILAIILLFVLVYYGISFIPERIRIVELYNSFIVGLTKFLQAVASIGTIYTMIGKMLAGIHVLLSYGLILLTVVLLFVMNYLISRPLFFYLTSKASEQASEKKHRVKREKRRGLFWTFLRKELIIASRSPNELLNNYAVLLFLPMIMYALNSIYMGLNRSSFGNQLVIIFNILIALTLITASSSASATAITVEGSEFVLLKTSPSKTKMIAWAKMAFHFVLSSLLLLMSFILFQIALPIFDKTTIWLIFTFAFFFNASQILWSFQLDVVSPKLSEYASTGSLSENTNIRQSLTNGFMISLFFTLGSILLLLLFPKEAWYVMIGVSLSWFLFRLKNFHDYLEAYFIDIEY
ncbi:MAG: hypothetical protein AB7U79_05830 [Candidatus Izemoplasmatales bacterium]